MARKKLKDMCLFVDAKTLDGTRLPTKTPFAHVLDQRTKPAKALIFHNDTAGFIARFIVMGVDTTIVQEIVRSEFGTQVTNPKNEVDKVLALLQDYVEDRTDGMKHEPPDGHVEPHDGSYDLDFSVNWYGSGGGSKVPF
jgi:hypothetical protein